MSTTQPIRSREALCRFKNYYRIENPNLRNYSLIITGLNTALRISDILSLRWADVYEIKADKIREHLLIREQKTGKKNMIAINHSLMAALEEYKDAVFSECRYDERRFLFSGQKKTDGPLSRSQAYRIVKSAAEHSGLYEHISCHSLRKTFGYQAWQQGTPPALLMDIYNHSSYRITKKYLCIEQDERDSVYENILL